MELIDTPVGILTLMSLVATFVVAARTLPLGAVSLPCITAITSLMYFFIMPAISLANGINEFLGLNLRSLEWAHWLVFIYLAGAAAAFFAQGDVLMVDPSLPRRGDRDIDLFAFKVLWAVAAGGVALQIVLGKLNLMGSADYVFEAEHIEEFAFVTQAYNLMIPLTLLLVLRDDFKWRSLLVLAVVLLIFLQVGFRFRILILICAVATSFFLVQRIKIKMSHAVVGGVGAVFLVNVLAQIRRYGQGVDLSALEDASVGDFFSSFPGEIGIVFVTAYIAANPLPALAMFEPWTVALARLVPSFLWPDKPTADYTLYFAAGLTAEGADKAGVAAPQQVEMLLQFGWIGVPLLAFFYFSIAIWLVSRLHKLGREARIAGCSLVPVYFGYYMQTRGGYFFQIFADAIFVIGPLFLLNLREGVHNSRAGASYARPRSWSLF